MSIVIKGFGRSIVGVLTVGLLGCGGLFHSPNPDSELYRDLHKARDLQERGKYKAALAKYEQVSKKPLQSALGRKVIHVGVLTHLKYHIAFCYAKLAETEGEVSLADYTDPRDFSQNLSILKFSSEMKGVSPSPRAPSK